MEYRHEIYRLYDQEHLTERAIARKLDLSPSTVHYWITRQGEAAKTKSGRPRVTSPDMDQAIYTASIRDPFLTAVDLRLQVPTPCSVDTVRNRLKERGLKCRIPARKPFLTEAHRQLRHMFATSHLHWSVDVWHRVVFSDEKIFRSSTRGPLVVYRPLRGSDRYDDQYIVPSSSVTGQSPFTICVWMAFGGNGRVRHIHRVEQKTLNAQYYTTRILPLIAPHLSGNEEEGENELLFMQDLSSIHMSRLTLQWLERNNISLLDDWPPKGPDMNPVENVWAELVRRVEKRTRGEGSNNRDQLWENIQYAFETLEDDYFDNLVESMPRRVDTVSSKSGGWSKY
ncbi:transposable element Tcb2 transposase [Caerostris extrusa]|uniref:Transposable element Tcb2 transposase n=1 Tax=Caerostris extrusa TaxID=172846 RepID=A0AAV4TUJ4_CAEEX|nr:transposable element Tcb2 transposase [Caerostris extrusa]